MGDQNKTNTKCLILGLIFGPGPRFFCSLEQKVDAALHIGVPILLEMQIRDMPEVQPDSQFVTQIMPGVVERRDALPLPALISPCRHLDVGMPAIVAEVDLGNVRVGHSGIVHFESDEFG